MTKKRKSSASSAWAEGSGRRLPEPTANRTYKNRLFLDLFKQPQDLLDLYNAVNGSHYKDPSLLEINTLEEVLYLGMKNDVSFLIGSEMNLYEAQSTWNPNMPLRGLFYFARLYQGYVDSHRLDVYSYLVSRVRYHLSRGMTLKGAADSAIRDCLRENVLVEYLTKHRAEATMSILTEYDEEKQLRYAFRDGKAEGRAMGKTEGKNEQLLSLICRKLKKGKTVDQVAEDLDEDVSVIRPLYEAALPYAPDFDHEKIYQELYPEPKEDESWMFW